MQAKKMYTWFDISVVALIFLFSSCSISKQINKQAGNILLKDSIAGAGHIGISIYEPATNKYWYQYEATKYFVPASNVKLFTTYAAMKYLGDSLVGLRYEQKENGLTIYPTGDPTFLDTDFKQQKVYDFLKNKSNITYASQHFINALGQGWAWDDYIDNYMVQRSEFPIYNNLISVYNNKGIISVIPKTIEWVVKKDVERYGSNMNAVLYRSWDNNNLTIMPSLMTPQKNIYNIPYVTSLQQVGNFLSDTLKQKISLSDKYATDSSVNRFSHLSKIYSQPTDSMLKPMLFTSDNFFAEQSLLMVSNEHLGYMNVEDIIDTLLNSGLKDIPQKPRWVDGSGLSRYNLFTPQSFVYILNKMKNEFGLDRMKRILPTGGEGTLKNFYTIDKGFIYAKTGSLSSHVSISGFMYSKKGKLLIFSVLANHFQGSATKVRHAVEKFLEGVREKY